MSQRIHLDATPGLFHQVLHCHQGDVGRQFEIAVVTRDGYEIPSGATFKIQATKPSGLGFTVTGTAANNIISFTSTEDMTSEAGEIPTQLEIKSGNDVIYTSNFLLVCEKNTHPSSVTDGSPEEIISEITLLVERAETAASTAATDAANAAQARVDEMMDYLPSEVADLKSDLNSLATSGVAPVQYSVQVGMINSSGQDDQNGNNSYRRTDYINLADVDNVTISASASITYWYALYDSSKTFISRTILPAGTVLDNLGGSGYIRLAAYSGGGLTDEVFASYFSIGSSKSYIADSISEMSGDISDIKADIEAVDKVIVDGVYIVTPADSSRFLEYDIKVGDKFKITVSGHEIGTELKVGTHTTNGGSSFTEVLLDGTNRSDTTFSVIAKATVNASYFKIFDQSGNAFIKIEKCTDETASSEIYSGAFSGKVVGNGSLYYEHSFNIGDEIEIEFNSTTIISSVIIGFVSNNPQAGFEKIMFNSLNLPVGNFKVKHIIQANYRYIKIYSAEDIAVNIGKITSDSDILSSSVLGSTVVTLGEISPYNSYFEGPVYANTYYHIHLSNVPTGCEVAVGSNAVGRTGFTEKLFSIANATENEYDVICRATINEDAFKCSASVEGVKITIYSFKCYAPPLAVTGGDIGYVACGKNVDGGKNDYCVAIGSNTLHDNTGVKNISIGNDNMGDCTGHDNTSEGYHALFRNTAGNCNSAVGSESQDDNTTGNYNSAVGFCSLQRNNTGSYNSVVGAFALQGIYSDRYDPENLKSFTNNVAVGANSLINAESGSANNVAIGYNSLGTQKQYNNCIAIGKDTDCTKNNQMVLGASSITEVVFCGNKKINFNNDGTVTWEILT